MSYCFTSPGLCLTPRWRTIAHGIYIYIYLPYIGASIEDLEPLGNERKKKSVGFEAALVLLNLESYGFGEDHIDLDASFYTGRVSCWYGPCWLLLHRITTEDIHANP